MKRARLLTHLSVIALVVGACTSGSGGPSTGDPPSSANPTSPASSEPSSPPPVEHVAVMLDFYPDTIYAPLQRGIEQGFFEAEGIELEIVPSSGSALTLQELAAGNIDFAFSSFARYAQDRIENDGDSRAIYAYFNTPTVGVVATSEIEDPADLVGKRFGTVPFSAGRVQLPFVLEANGVDPDDVPIELMDFSVLYSTLFDGGIESAEMHLPGEDTLFAEAEERGVKVYFKRLADWGFKDYSKTLLASGSVMADNPELVRRVVRAIDRSITDAIATATPEEIFNSLRVLDEQASEEGAAAGWSNVVDLMDGEPGELSEDVAEYVLELSTSATGEATDLEPGDLYTNDFLP